MNRATHVLKSGRKTLNPVEKMVERKAEEFDKLLKGASDKIQSRIMRLRNGKTK